MKYTKSVLAEIIDFVLLSLVVGCASFVFMRTKFSVVISVCGAIATVFPVLALLRQRSKTGRLKRREEKLFKDTADALTYAGEQKRLEYFAERLSRFGEAAIGDGYITLKDRRVYCLFDPSGIALSELYRIHNECVKAQTKAVIVTPHSPDRFHEEFLSGSDRLKFLPKSKLQALILDSPLVCKETPKRKGVLKRLLKGAVDRSLFRRYLACGALLIGTSYLFARNVLYIAAGALCLALSLLCLLPLKKRKPS